MTEKVIFDIYTSLYKTEDYPPIICKLPSRGLIYDSNHVFNKTGNAFIQKFNGKTEEWISEPLLDGDTEFTNYLVESSILLNNPKLDIDDMLVADRDMIIINQRNTSYGTVIRGLKANCQQCEKALSKKTIIEGQKNQNSLPIEDSVDANVDKIEVEFLNIQPIEPNKNLFFFKVDDYDILFKFPTIKDNKYFNSFIKQQTDVPTIEFLSVIIESINGNKNKLAIKKTLTEEFTLKQSRQFQSYFEKHNPYVRIHLSPLTCFECNHINKIIYPIDSDFLGFNSIYTKIRFSNDVNYLTKTFQLTFNDIYTMPTEMRKRLIEAEEERLAKAKNKPS